MDKAEYAEYLKTDHWREVRDRALEYALHRCQLCNSPKNVQVHHRTYERVGREWPCDLTVLCEACHEKHHDRHKSTRVVIRPAAPPPMKFGERAAQLLDTMREEGGH